MTILRIDANRAQPTLHDSPQPVDCALRQTRNIPGPVVIMTHGFTYRPHARNDCPHQLVFSSNPRNMHQRVVSWPNALGVDQSNRLAIAFGWNATGTLWTARSQALEAGRAMAKMIVGLKRENPNRHIHFIGHSLGIELALEALFHLEPGDLNRVISMTGAAYQARVRHALSTKAGQATEFINVATRENDVFDFLFERLIPPQARNDRAIGLGIEAPNAVTLQLDCNDCLRALAGLGISIAPSKRRICHWSSYIRPGVFNLYERLLSDDEQLSQAALREALPDHTAARWSRLFAMPRYYPPLPIAQNTS